MLESTSPPYSTRMVEKIVSETSGLAPEQFMTAHCPERIIPGRMLIELRENDRHHRLEPSGIGAIRQGNL